MLCKHFQIKHTSHNFFSYNCIEDNCNRSFHLLNSFKKHLATHVPIETSTPIQQNDSTNTITNSLPLEQCNTDTLPIIGSLVTSSSLSGININSSVTENNTVEKCISSLYANPQVPRNVVQKIVEDMKNIFNSIKHNLKNDTNKLLLEEKNL